MVFVVSVVYLVLHVVRIRASTVFVGQRHVVPALSSDHHGLVCGDGQLVLVLSSLGNALACLVREEHCLLQVGIQSRPIGLLIFNIIHTLNYNYHCL